MATLVLAEHDNRALTPATRSAVAAAMSFGADVHVLVTGADCATAAGAAAGVPGVVKVLQAQASYLADQTAENVAATLLAAVRAGGYSHLVAPAAGLGRAVLPRVAAALDVEQVADVVAIEAPDTFVRPIYAGALLATVQSRDPVKVVTVRPIAFEPVPAAGGTAPIESVPAAADTGLSRVVTRESSRSDRPDLASARVVVAGGRALGSAENFKLLDALAARLGGAVGASRAAVDAGYVGNNLQIGQSGKIVSPDLYVAVGISGAVQHIAGMKDSKVIVAINRDPEAPIFQLADYGLVGDLFEVVPALLAALD
ncbi:MAG: electron transfer flavoprotein subunit alpha/FixB family protein [Dehalococcoidia bacterium]|nr:electron transfer flavoprotein subunit alpha/FixB family protein [Dehalococcoidia bacterium]